MVDEGALDRVLRVDPRSGARTIVTEAPFVFIVSIAVEATGQLVAANENFPVGVLRVDPSSGVRTVVSDMTTGSGLPLASPAASRSRPRASSSWWSQMSCRGDG